MRVGFYKQNKLGATVETARRWQLFFKMRIDSDKFAAAVHLLGDSSECSVIPHQHDLDGMPTEVAALISTFGSPVIFNRSWIAASAISWRSIDFDLDLLNREIYRVHDSEFLVIGSGEGEIGIRIAVNLSTGVVGYLGPNVESSSEPSAFAQVAPSIGEFYYRFMTEAVFPGCYFDVVDI